MCHVNLEIWYELRFDGLRSFWNGVQKSRVLLRWARGPCTEVSAGVVRGGCAGTIHPESLDYFAYRQGDAAYEGGPSQRIQSQSG